MLWLTILFSSILGGAVQSVTGFGCGVVMMLFLPQVLSMVSSSALVAASSVGLTAALTWHYRRTIRWKTLLFPSIIYLSCSTLVLNIIGGVDLNLLKTVFGLFLLVLSGYLLFFSKRVHLKAGIGTAVLCSVVSGIGSGLFAIGGPLMALYYLDLTESREEYIGTLETFFLLTALVNTTTRAIKGYFTLGLILPTILGILGINLGKQLGLILGKRLDPDATRKLVYACVGVSGAVTLAQQLL